MSTLKQATKAAKTKTERIVTMGQASIEDLMRKYRTEQRKKAIARAIAQILSKVFPGFNYTTAKATRIIENLTTLRLESGAVSGRILGKYELIEEIGQGGFSQVFKARNLIDDSEVAVKVLQKKWLKKREYLIRIHREGQLLGGMSCENIVRFMDRGKDDGVDYIVTELVSGQGLDDFMESRGPFAFQFALEVGVQVARALEYLHGKGIVHREIKPANIFIQPNGTIKLFDFFLAKSSNLLRFPQITLPNTFLGTPGYVSPEQAAARIEAIDSRSDIYSLGVILYEMLTGKNPFDASSAWEILQRQIHFQPPVPSKFKPDIPATVDSIVMKALAKDPPKRYQTASQFRADMERIFKCPSCGTPNWPGSTFCDTCGAQLSYPKLR